MIQSWIEEVGITKRPDTVFDSLSQTHILYSGSKGLPLFKTANTM
jgi:hypothetical protein